MKNILEKVEQYVTQLLTEKLHKHIYFHNLKHTRQVIKAAREISEHMELSPQEKELLEIAIWFHDTGFTKDYINHEEEGAKIAEAFLKKENYPQEKIKIIKKAILKTSLDTLPDSKIEKIIRDADLAHVAKKSGIKRGELLRKELHFFCNKEYSDIEWYEVDKDFYQNINYFTEYALSNWQPRIEENISRIEKKIMEIKTNEQNPVNEQKELSEKFKKRLKKIKTTERGVETVFRTTSRNHLRLSSIADTKANTLISVSALVISILISFLVENIDVQSHLLLPTSILLLACVATIIFSTFSTRPKVTKLTLTRDDIKKRRGNLLFFGNFYQMQLSDFEWGMKELMEDRDYLYSNLTKDIYFLGLVLAKKYKYLSIAYNVFMYGIIISVMAFIIAMYSTG